MSSVSLQVRGERFVAKVLDATLHELSTVGYRALSIEVVAERAGVNKTSIYRRWPRKADLVQAALHIAIDELLTTPDEGSLRADLVAFARRIRDTVATPRGRGLFRVMAAESEHPELVAIWAYLNRTTRCIPEEIVARAVQRGELPKRAEAELVVQCVVAPIVNWIQMENLVVSDRRVEQVVDLVLHGARAEAPPRRARAHAPKAARPAERAAARTTPRHRPSRTAS
ncbi:MAG: TetR/AcrR family transcriptional regulator [Labilithrix sp.]|nr:TetR/AcrR family transcriptional regulator [Labilithrix sp.]